MAKMMTLHELIDYVKEDLLTPLKADSPEELYPFLFVEEVELEVNVAVTDKLSDSGKLTIYVLEAGLGGEKAQEKGHKIKVRLTPLVTKEEMRARLRLDERLWKKIEQTTGQAAVKEPELQEG